jgi:hypothetical protein
MRTANDRRCGFGARAKLAAMLGAFTLGCASPSSASFINVGASVLNGNEITGDFSQDGELDFDTRFTSMQPIELKVEIGDSDGTVIAFSGFHLNDSGTPWNFLRIGLRGRPTFSEANRAAGDTPGSFASASFAGNRAQIVLVPPEELGVVIGEPGLDINPGVDWFIALNGLQSGDSFTIVLAPAVPLPSTAWLLVAGFAGCMAVRRGKQKDGAAGLRR